MSARARWTLGPVLCTLVTSCLGDCSDKTPLPPGTCLASQGGLSNTADSFEPNDDLTLATEPAPGTGDCGRTERAGTISGASDVDVFRTGVCDLTDDDHPFAELETGSASLRLCLIFACDFGTTTVFSCSSGEDDSSDDSVVAARTDGGFRGCCRTGEGKVFGRVQCSGFPFRNRGVKAFVWIDDNGASDQDDHPYRVRYQLQ